MLTVKGMIDIPLSNFGHRDMATCLFIFRTSVVKFESLAYGYRARDFNSTENEIALMTLISQHRISSINESGLLAMM